jgi:hypothetical protein
MDSRSGFKKIRPGPTNPLDTIFISLTDSQVQNLAQSHLLVEKKPIKSRIPISISIQPAFLLRDWRATAPTQRVSGCDTSSRGVAFLVIEFVSSFFSPFPKSERDASLAAPAPLLPAPPSHHLLLLRASGIQRPERQYSAGSLSRCATVSPSRSVEVRYTVFMVVLLF